MKDNRVKGECMKVCGMKVGDIKDGDIKPEVSNIGRQLSRVMIQKIICSALILSVIFPLFLLPAGCSSTQDSGGDDSFMQKYEAPTEKLEHISLKFYFPGEQPKGWPDVKAELEKRSADSVNASLDFKWLDFGQYTNKINAINASGEVFDAFCLAKPDSIYPDFSMLAREGKLADITTLFLENAHSLYSKYTQKELEYAKVENKLYAVPSLYPTANCSILMVDDALSKEYNIPEITHLSQYEQYLKAVKQNDPQLIPGTISGSVHSMQLFAGMFGYVILDEYQNLVYKRDDPRMKIQAWEQTPEFLEAAGRIADWYGKGYLQFNPDPMKVASFLHYGQLNPPSEEPKRMYFSSGTNELKQSNPMKVFYLNHGDKVQRDNAMGSFYWNGAFVFPSASVNTARALRFLDWVQQNRDNYYLMMYGVENKDYVMKDGYPNYPEGQDYKNRTYLYWGGYWAFRNAGYESDPPVKDAYGIGINTLTEFLDKYTEYAPHGAFYPNYGRINDSTVQRSQAINRFETRLMEGQIEDTGEVTKLISDMKQLGIDNLTAEIQTQLDKRKGS